MNKKVSKFEPSWPNPEKWISAARATEIAAKILPKRSIDRSTIWKWASSGKVDAVKAAGHIYILRSSLESWCGVSPINTEPRKEKKK